MSVNRGDVNFVLSADPAQVQDSLNKVKQNAQSTGNSIQGGFSGAFKSILAGFTGLASVGALVSLSDQAMLTAARLKMVTGSTDSATNAQRELFAMAQKLQVPFAELQQVFVRIMPAIKELKGGVREATALSDILVTTAKISGATQQEAAASALQFAQALGSGKLQGDELKSILENNQTLARELAGALGVSIGQLREMGKEGQLTSDKVANALLGRYDQIKAQAAELPSTVAGSLTQVGNSFAMLFSELNKGDGPMSAVISAFKQIAAVIDIISARFRVAGKDSGDMKDTATKAGQAVGMAFAYVADVLDAVWLKIKDIGNQIGGVFAASSRALQGDFAGAYEILKDVMSKSMEASAKLGNALSRGGKTMQAYQANLGSEGNESSAETRRLQRTSGQSGFVKLVGGPKQPDKGKKDDSDPSFMQTYDTALEARKLTYEKENQMREFSKQQELDYWRELMETYEVTNKDRGIIALKTAKLEVEIARNAAKQQSEITTLRNEDRAKAELDHIGQLQAIAQQEKDLGLISQQELLAQQKEFNNQRMAAELELLTQKLELAKLDPDKNLVLIEQLEIQKLEIMRKYAGIQSQLSRDMQAESMQPMKNIIDTMANSVTTLGRTLLTDWKNIGKNLKKIFADIGLSIIEETITKPLKAKFAAWLSEKIFGKAKTIGRMGELAAEAGAGGVASMAAAPFPLNFGAPAFGAAMSAAALAFAPMASAAGGFDIPAGVNPIVQAHAREMILPEKQADVIRDMADGGGGGGGVVHYHISALDSKSFEQYLKDNPAALSAGNKHAARRGF